MGTPQLGSDGSEADDPPTSAKPQWTLRLSSNSLNLVSTEHIYSLNFLLSNRWVPAEDFGR